MKLIQLVVFLFLFLGPMSAQNTLSEVEEACMKYLEGFYEGDTTKLQSALSPTLYKFGYWKDKKTGKYASEGQMTYQQAIDYSKNVMASKKFVGADAPKKVEVLDTLNHIAAAKVTAWWGYDYLLLSKTVEGWRIEQVLWEGPL